MDVAGGECVVGYSYIAGGLLVEWVSVAVDASSG